MPAGVSSVYIQTILVKNASAPIFFDLDLYLYNSAGIFLGQSSGNSQGSEAIYVWPPLVGGPYFYIEARWSSGNEGIYRLTFTFTYEPPPPGGGGDPWTLLN
jgi:hypothetical protein